MLGSVLSDVMRNETEQFCQSSSYCYLEKTEEEEGLLKHFHRKRKHLRNSIEKNTFLHQSKSGAEKCSVGDGSFNKLVQLASFENVAAMKAVKKIAKTFRSWIREIYLSR